MADPAVTPVPADRLVPGDFLADVRDEELVYFLVNVGDGDTQLLLLPKQGPGRRALVVDVASTGKLPALVEAIRGPLGLAPAAVRPFALVVGTHPHDDHIGGMAEFVRRYADEIVEYWEPGYWHTSLTYHDVMNALEDSSILHGQPTSGMTRYVDNVKVVALSPGVGLRNRFDSYGIELNNSSIALKLEFPASRVQERDAKRLYLRIRNTQRLILGGDAQTLSWAQVMVDFPELRADASGVAKQLRMATGADPLRAQVFKIPHHASKHGLNLELMELVDPDVSLVSSVAGGGKYNFPHRVALESLREALQPIAKSGDRASDLDLGIHFTSGRDDAGAALGTIALVVPPTGELRMWRFGDSPRAKVDLAAGRRMTAFERVR